MSLRVSMVALLLSACAWRSEDGEPVEVPIALEFPSVTAAVTVDRINLYAFPSGNCTDIMQEYRTSRRDGIGSFSQSVLLSADICSVYQGRATVNLDLGTYALVAIGIGAEGYTESGPVGQHDYFTGCVEQTVGGSETVLPITMALATDVPPALKTTCASLQQLCSETCPGRSDNE